MFALGHIVINRSTTEQATCMQSLLNDIWPSVRLNPHDTAIGLVLKAKYVSLRPHHMLWLVPSMTMAFCQPAIPPALSLKPSDP
jgi:hypothetical protein